MIQLVRHVNIDFNKWDACVSSAIHSEIYALSWFLNCVSPQWDAIIYNDYEAVMPLPIKSKYGIRYVVQPPLCQKLGVFSPHVISKDIYEKFETILSKYISVRYATYAPIFNTKKSKEQANYTIDLHKNHVEIEHAFNKNCKRNIKKAIKNNITSHTISHQEFLDFYIPLFAYPGLEHYKKIIAHLLDVANTNHALECIGTKKNNSINSAVAFLKTPKTYYYLLANSNVEGKENSSMFLLIQNFIQKHAQENAILDFEGSQIKGIAKFYKSFGAIYTPYYFFTSHRLPFLGKYMKKT